MSPPRTVSSVTSNHSNESSRSGEYVLVPYHTEDDVKEDMVWMRTGPIKHSLVRQELVHQRNLTGSINWDVSITYNGVCSMGSVELTWRRPKSASTHRTTCYVIPGLKTDLYLGYEDSGEEAPGEYAVAQISNSVAVLI